MIRDPKHIKCTPAEQKMTAMFSTSVCPYAKKYLDWTIWNCCFVSWKCQISAISCGSTQHEFPWVISDVSQAQKTWGFPQMYNHAGKKKLLKILSDNHRSEELDGSQGLCGGPAWFYRSGVPGGKEMCLLSGWVGAECEWGWDAGLCRVCNTCSAFPYWFLITGHQS